MAKIRYPKELEELYEQLSSERSAERYEAAFRLQMDASVKFPRAGTINGSRARGKRAVIVPLELLELLASRAVMYEDMLKEVVKHELMQEGLLLEEGEQ